MVPRICRTKGSDGAAERVDRIVWGLCAVQYALQPHISILRESRGQRCGRERSRICEEPLPASRCIFGYATMLFLQAYRLELDTSCTGIANLPHPEEI